MARRPDFEPIPGEGYSWNVLCRHAPRPGCLSNVPRKSPTRAATAAEVGNCWRFATHVSADCLSGLVSCEQSSRARAPRRSTQERRPLARRALIEAAWTHRMRMQGAGQVLHPVWRLLASGKAEVGAVAVIASELEGFLWPWPGRCRSWPGAWGPAWRLRVGGGARFPARSSRAAFGRRSPSSQTKSSRWAISGGVRRESNPKHVGRGSVAEASQTWCARAI